MADHKNNVDELTKELVNGDRTAAGLMPPWTWLSIFYFIHIKLRLFVLYLRIA